MASYRLVYQLFVFLPIFFYSYFLMSSISNLHSFFVLWTSKPLFSCLFVSLLVPKPASRLTCTKHFLHVSKHQIFNLRRFNFYDMLIFSIICCICFNFPMNKNQNNQACKRIDAMNYDHDPYLQKKGEGSWIHVILITLCLNFFITALKA